MHVYSSLQSCCYNCLHHRWIRYYIIGCYYIIGIIILSVVTAVHGDSLLSPTLFVLLYFIYLFFLTLNWWSGVVVSALASINELNLRWARLVLIWDGRPCPSLIPGARHLFRYVTNQPSSPPGCKWVPVSVGKVKAGMVHSVSWWTRGVQVKLWDSLRTRAISERLIGVITTRRYTNPHLPLPIQLVFLHVYDLWQDLPASIVSLQAISLHSVMLSPVLVTQSLTLPIN